MNGPNSDEFQGIERCMIFRPSHVHEWALIPDPSGIYVGAECRTCGVVRDDG